MGLFQLPGVRAPAKGGAPRQLRDRRAILRTIGSQELRQLHETAERSEDRTRQQEVEHVAHHPGRQQRVRRNLLQEGVLSEEYRAVPGRSGRQP